MKPEIRAKNLKLMRKKMGLLIKAMEMSQGSDCEYIIEQAKNSSLTLAIKKGDNVYQVHSKYNPQREAKQQVVNSKLINPKLLLIFGLGLGYHIRAYLEELKSENLFVIIIEKDIEALRAAIENVDLTDLVTSEKIFWVVGVPEEEGYPVLLELIKQAGITFQLFLKTLQIFEHPVIAKVHEDYNHKMTVAFREAAKVTIFNYGNCPEDSMIGVTNVMQNLATIMKNPGVKDLHGAFKNVPGIIVSTGPSLDKNIKDLSEALGKAVIVAADASLKPMEKVGISPTMVTALERNWGPPNFFLSASEEFKKNIWLAATPVILRSGYEAWNGPTFIIYRDFAHFEWISIDKGILNVGPSCSNMAFRLLEVMGCNPIILVGQDCGFEDLDKSHAEDTLDIAKKKHLTEANVFKVKGNYQDFIYTNEIYNIFRQNFVSDIAYYKGECINATEGGAYIEGSTLMTLKEAIAKYCSKPIDVHKVLNETLKYPTQADITRDWRKFRQVIIETRKEVEEVIDFCKNGVKLVDEFEERLEKDGYYTIEDFLERFPEQELNAVYATMTRVRGKVITFGKYFKLYLMHIVQMIIVQFEMDFNELPTLCQDPKRCKLQAIKLMRQWFPRIADVCQLSLNLLIDSHAELEKEFDHLL